MDASLFDNDGAITVNPRGPTAKPSSDSLRQNPPYMNVRRPILRWRDRERQTGWDGECIVYDGQPSTNYQIFLEEYNGPVGETDTGQIGRSSGM